MWISKDPKPKIPLPPLPRQIVSLDFGWGHFVPTSGLFAVRLDVNINDDVIDFFMKNREQKTAIDIIKEDEHLGSWLTEEIFAQYGNPIEEYES